MPNPPDWNTIEKHPMMPEATHDEVARFNFLSTMNRHLAAYVSPGNRKAFDQRVKPRFEDENGREFEDRNEVRDAMRQDPFYQLWSALRRDTMEMRQQAGRSLVLRQAQDLADKARQFGGDGANLDLDPDLAIPHYLTVMDNHLMPGSYHTELGEGDVTAAANYDAGIYVTTGGALGGLNDGGGRAIGVWIKTRHPEFSPKRILDIGCGMGHNTIPLAQAYPDAEVVAVDVGAPMLRYAQARAKALGVENVKWVQANGENLDYPDGHFDYIQTIMFWHETSNKALHRMISEVHRMLAPGGLTLHVEQPQYTDDMDLYEQFIRDWDAFYNNEPFWSEMHDLDVDQIMIDAGFKREDLLQIGVRAVRDDEDPTSARPEDEPEDHGRSAVWNVFGAWKSGKSEGGSGK